MKEKIANVIGGVGFCLMFVGGCMIESTFVVLVVSIILLATSYVISLVNEYQKWVSSTVESKQETQNRKPRYTYDLAELRKTI